MCYVNSTVHIQYGGFWSRRHKKVLESGGKIKKSYNKIIMQATIIITIFFTIRNNFSNRL